jgi:ABC-2 type transport system permease protein
MNKLFLIIKREYLTRVTRKSFILATLLTPLAFAVFIVVVSVIFAYQSDDVVNIVIKDDTNVLDRIMPDNKNQYFAFSNESFDELKERYNNKEFDGILVIPAIENPDNPRLKVQYFADKQLEPEASVKLKSELEKRLRVFQMKRLGLEEATLTKIDMSVSIDPDQVNKKVSTDDEPVEKAFTSLTSMVAAGIGGVMGFIMYLMVFINGSMVMRSVMEEKMNRIIEVMISSVKPFELMLGKILGVGAVGLTQFLIWAILIPLIVLGATFFLGIDTEQAMAMQQSGAMQTQNLDSGEMDPVAIINEIQRMNWWLIISMFVIFFLGGYFIYSSLFAAVGSAIGDDIGEGQSLTLPITIPVILAFYIMIVAIRSPNSSLAVWSSIFPLFSPIVMPARLAFNPPAWQIVLSVVLLIGSALFFVWLSGRIYRVGILMYGKKASFKELGKWIFSKY